MTVCVSQPPQEQPLYGVASGDYIPVIVAGIKGRESSYRREGLLNYSFSFIPVCVENSKQKHLESF